MEDKASQLKSIGELYQQGLLTPQEFEAEKARILRSSANRSPGPIPNHRRNGWVLWMIITSIVILGTFISSALYSLAYENCSLVDAYIGFCEPDSSLLLMSRLVDFVVLCVFIGQLYWNYKMFWEFNKYMRGSLTEPVLACIPLINIFVFYGYCTELNTQARLHGARNFLNPELTCCSLFVLGLGLPIYQDKLNKFWDRVRSQSIQASHKQPPQAQIASPIQQTVEWQ